MQMNERDEIARRVAAMTAGGATWDNEVVAVLSAEAVASGHGNRRIERLAFLEWRGTASGGGLTRAEALRAWTDLLAECAEEAPRLRFAQPWRRGVRFSLGFARDWRAWAPEPVRQQPQAVLAYLKYLAAHRGHPTEGEVLDERNMRRSRASLRAARL